MLNTLNWGTLVASIILLIPAGLLEKGAIEPTHRYFSSQDATIAFEMHNDTVPVWLVLLGFIVTLVILFFVEFFHCSDEPSLVKRFRNPLFLCINVFASMSFCFFVTDILKISVGRPRPDFLHRCYGMWGDAILDANPIVHGPCTGKASVVVEGRKAFVSGHTSQSFAYLFFLTLYLAWLVYVRRGNKLSFDDISSSTSVSVFGHLLDTP